MVHAGLSLQTEPLKLPGLLKLTNLRPSPNNNLLIVQEHMETEDAKVDGCTVPLPMPKTTHSCGNPNIHTLLKTELAKPDKDMSS